MVWTAPRLNATFFLSLLVVHNASRVSSGGSFLSVPAETDLTGTPTTSQVSASQRWNLANSKCRWSWRGHCRGKGCRSRKLPLDRSFSESCRLTNTYMLEHDGSGASYTHLMADVLEETSEKFEHHCWKVVQMQTMSPKRIWTCARKAGRMLHAQAFLASVRPHVRNLNHEVQGHVSAAMERIASTFGEEASVIRKLQNRLIKDPLAFGQDPGTITRKALATLGKLANSNKEDKDAAQDAARSISGDIENASMSKEEGELDHTIVQLQSKYAADPSFDPTVSLDELVPSDDNEQALGRNLSTQASSLLELPWLIRKVLKSVKYIVMLVYLFGGMLMLICPTFMTVCPALEVVSLVFPLMVGSAFVVPLADSLACLGDHCKNKSDNAADK